MALTLKISACQPNDCSKLQFWDSTGVYDVSTNPGGYGAPNITTALVTSATINVYPPTYTVPIIFSFLMTAGTITSITRTDGNGVSTSVLSSFSNVFPFDVNNKITFTSALLGLGTDVNLESGDWYIQYIVNTASLSYNTSADFWLFCTAECCVEKMKLKITPGNCGCEDDSWGNKYRQAKTYLEAAQYAATWGLKDQAQLSLDEANKICGSNCKDC